MRDPGLRTQHRAELQVGALVLLSIVVLVWGVIWITSSGIGGGGFSFHVFTPDAQQVTAGDRVFLHGVDVGSVEHVGLGEGGVVLDLSVSPQVSIPADSKASIQSAGFLGSQNVVLQPGSSSRKLAPGDTI
ncbi:MAG TPA: MlaD family protein, partial [Gemmatimonadota bacterium]|nr:MlaD family protein [Gemmatimonadota bacterium]